MTDVMAVQAILPVMRWTCWNVPRLPAAALPLLLAVLLAGTVAVPAHAGLNRWTPIGPYGGLVLDLAIDPHAPRVLYAAVSQNGVFKSTDGGITWQPAGRGLPRWATALAVAVDPRQPAKVYAVIGEQGLFRSSDGGATWARVSSSEVVANSGLTVLRVDPGDSSILYLGNFLGFFKSTDGGATWRPSPGLQGLWVTSIAFEAGSPSTLYVADGREGSILKSRDGGKTWEPRNAGLPRATYIWLETDPSSPGTLYAAFDRFGEVLPVYKSVDGAESWTLTAGSGYPVALGPSGAVYTPIARSFDAGATWSPTAPPEGGSSFYDLRLLADPGSPGTVYAARGGISKSTDGAATWQKTSRGITGTGVSAMALDPNEPSTLYASISGSLLRTRQGGNVWEDLTGNLPEFRQFPEITPLVVDQDSNVYAGVRAPGTREPFLGKSSDRGATWDLLPLPASYLQISLTVDPTAPQTLYLGGGSSNPAGCLSFRSDDGGETWNCLGIGRAWDFVVDPLRPTTVYAAKSGQSIPWKSLDRGSRWSPIRHGLPSFLEYMALAIDPDDSSNLYLATRLGLYKRAGGDPSWNRIGGRLLSQPVYAVAVDPQTPSRVFVAARDGFYRSEDAGRSWKPMSQGLPPDPFHTFFHEEGTWILIDPRHPETLYVNSRFWGIFKITLSPAK